MICGFFGVELWNRKIGQCLGESFDCWICGLRVSDAKVYRVDGTDLRRSVRVRQARV